jgi:hypothetical protein
MQRLEKGGPKQAARVLEELQLEKDVAVAQVRRWGPLPCPRHVPRGARASAMPAPGCTGKQCSCRHAQGWAGHC